jgi:hypothetical protein
MEKHKFTLSLTGNEEEATKKVQALAVLASHLSEETLSALAKLVKEDPAKVEFAKHYLGIT